MAQIVLHAANPAQVSSASSLEVELGVPTKRLMIFSGIAAPEIGVDDDDEFYDNEVIVKLGVNVSLLEKWVSQVGLASVENDESRLVFATNTGTVEVDGATGELQLRVHTTVCGDETFLHRFGYQVVAELTKVASQISGSIRVPDAVLSLANKSRAEVETMFRIRANRIDKVPPPPGPPPPFSDETLTPVATGRVVNVTFAGGEGFVEYVIEGCPFNTPLRVTVNVSDLFRGLEPQQVAGPRTINLTSLVPSVGGVDFTIIQTRLP